MGKQLYNYSYYKASEAFQTNRARYNHWADEILKYKPSKVLDVGCGIGTLVRILRTRGIEAFGMDFAECLPEYYWNSSHYIVADARHIPFKDKEFDLVFSSDFFEHIPEEEIDTVIKEMKRAGKVVLSNVAPAAMLNLKQLQYHCTNKPKEWWEDKLKGIKLIWE